eukprot:scaffold1248_cov104-Skeletonema_marinoi.AAC.8
MQSKEIGWQEQISYEEAHELETDLAIFTLTNVSMLEGDVKFHGRSALASRIHRDGEDLSSTMMIMARVNNHDKTLCVLKMYQDGMISASPALMEEDSDDMYCFITPDEDNLDYNIEMMIDQDYVEGDDTLLNSSRIYEEKRRQLSWKEVDDTEHAFNYQTHVEIISAAGFTQPNILFSAPFGSTLVIRYKIRKTGEFGGKEAVFLKGSTNKFQSYDIFSTSMQFLVRKSSNNDHPANISHQNAMMEMHAYFHHNFGMISLAGSAVVHLPSEPGTYDINVPTFKPIACPGMNERRCRMQSYYLGTCLSEILPSEPASLPSNEDGELTTRLLCKAGQITDGSGIIHLRVNVMKNYFNSAYSNTSDELESPQHRVKVQETVDEVLSRVRRNKRVRMSRMMVPSSNPANRNAARMSGRLYRSVASNEEKAEVEETKQSDRTADVLQRVGRSL